jgi:redox-sensitive bicupin YhaK (pirin superfamily)
MQTMIRRATERGHADWGWLDTHHTFSFDPAMMGFGHLRVINEDRVTGGHGFDTHPHRNMEIISYVVDGALAHKDTTGSGGVLRHGDVQTMSAGRGVAHSERNGSPTETVHFLQIWLLPAAMETEPTYGQRHFPLTDRGPRLVVSPDGRDGSMPIGQDTDLWRLLLDDGEELTHAVARRRVWIQVVTGTLSVGEHLLHSGDGLAVVDAEALTLHAKGEVEALLFDLR